MHLSPEGMMLSCCTVLRIKQCNGMPSCLAYQNNDKASTTERRARQKRHGDDQQLGLVDPVDELNLRITEIRGDTMTSNALTLVAII